MNEFGSPFAAYQRDVIAATLDTRQILAPVAETELESLPFAYDALPPYEQLSRRLLLGFKQMSAAHHGENLRWASIEHGFNVVGRGVASCALAYSDFVKTNGHTSDVSEFVAAVNNPKTIRTFTDMAGMSNIENREYEAWLGVISTNIVPGSFAYNPQENSFEPEDWAVTAAEDAARQARLRTIYPETWSPQGISSPNDGTCLARSYIPMIWKSYVAAAQEEGIIWSMLNVKTTNQVD